MAVRTRVKTPPKPPTRRKVKAPEARTKRAHIRRVTLNLIRHAACCPRPLKLAINRLAKLEWDMDALKARDLDTIYAHVDDDLAERAKNEFAADTHSIVDHRGSTWVCELCGHQGCRWEFTLANVKGGTNVQTGSNCIIEYSLSVDGEISATEALKRLRAAIARMKRVEEREIWQEANPTHVANMQRIQDVYDYVTKPIRARSLWGYLKAGWNRRMNPWQKKVKATIKFYRREEFLTAKRTSDLPGLIKQGAEFYTERRTAEDTIDGFVNYWDRLIVGWSAHASDYELGALRYGRKWKMDPDRCGYRVADTVRVLARRTGFHPGRDDDGNAITDPVGGAAVTTTSTTSAPDKAPRTRSARRKASRKRRKAPTAPTKINPVNDDHPF